MTNVDSGLILRHICDGGIQAHAQPKLDKSARSNYTMAGKLAIADDYYLARIEGNS